MLAPSSNRMTMGHFLFPLLVFVLIGGAASVWLFKVRDRREQVSTGLMALSAMHWRELQRLVVGAMRARGFQPHLTAEAREEEGLVALARENQTWLLSTKHGTAYVLGTAAVGEFANALRLHGAHGGVMATVGEVSADTRSRARAQRIEVLDDGALWAEVAPLLEPEQRNLILGEVHARTRRHAALAWGLAFIAAALAFLLLPKSAPADVPVATTQPATQKTAGTVAPNTAAASASPPQVGQLVPEDTAALAARRTKLAGAIATLPWVGRAAWSTPSTLVIDLQGGAAADKAALCKLVEAYPELRASRLQVQPPNDSGQAVRFMQCRTY